MAGKQSTPIRPHEHRAVENRWKLTADKPDKRQ